MHALIYSLFVFIFVLYVFEFGNRLTFTFQPKWFFFFLSDSELPMLWYSFVQVPWYFILGLTLIPLIVKFKNKYVCSSFLIFYSYLFFFVFLAKPHTSHLYARYVYTALPFFIILLAVSISYLLLIPKIFANRKFSRLFYLLFILIFLGTIFNVNNTLVAAEGKLTEEDDRQVISVPYRNYDELIRFLNKNNFSKSDIVITSELRMKDTIAWYYDFDFHEGRNITSFNTLTYDIADNIYLLNESSVEVVKKYDSGWIIRRDGHPFPKSISEDSMEEVEAREELKNLSIQIEYLGEFSLEYQVYKWNRK